MTVDPLQLLRRLEPAVRPGAAPAARTGDGAPLERRSFDDLLAMVSTGTVSSGRPVALGAAAEIEPPLDDEQLGRLAAAADLALSRGANRAVMLLDGRGLVMDVARRTVTAELAADAADPLIEIDAAVYVAGEDDDERLGRRRTALGPSGIAPPTVAHQLETAASRIAGREAEHHTPSSTTRAAG